MTQEIRKYVLYALLAFIAVALWNAWEKQHSVPGSVIASQVASSTTASPHTVTNANSSVPVHSSTAQTSSAAGYTPSVYKPTEALHHSASAPITSDKAAVSQNLITVKTNTLDVHIDLSTGNLVKLGLVKYPVSIKEPNIPFTLMNTAPGKFYVSQSGLIDSNGNPLKVTYTTEQRKYVMSASENTMNVVLLGKTQNGLVVKKTYHFVKGQYVVDVKYSLTNNTAKTWAGSFYGQLTRQPQGSHGFLSGRSYHGASVSTKSKPYDEVKYKWLNENSLSRDTKGGWIAVQQQYFLSAWVPVATENNHYYSHTTFKTNDEGKAANIYTVGFVAPQMVVKSHQTKTSSARFLAGPEVGKMLDKVAPGLSLTVDYGWLYILSKAIFWLMDHIHTFVGNWGLSIILVTLVIKLIFYKLSASSYKSMARMRKLAPKMKILKDRYGDDKQKMSKETMALYKKEKVNPAGGCLPMLVQIPFFIALYYVLIESVQLRQAGFLWIHDLSLKDPYYILPILVGITMFIQQKISPAPPDPTQAKAMMLLPVVFTVMFINFPAGLTLYWFTNNLLTIAQQWYVMRSVEKADAKKKRK
jgi:YidC/Oxa1 family membrane protein insertase